MSRESAGRQSRRVFLKSGAFAFVSLGFAPSFLARTAFAAGASARRKMLVAVFQRGAVDGLNVVVPFDETEYYRARPSIGIRRPGSSDIGAVDLNGFFGFHPRLRPLKPLWDTRRLAIVHACGSPDSTRSHFDAQDFMETATPGVKSTTDGWLNRYLQARRSESAAPFRAVALAPQLPRMLQGPAAAMAIGQIGQFGIRAGQAGDAVASSFEAAYGSTGDRVLNGTAHETFDAMRQLKIADPAKYAPENGAEYPASAFGRALQQIAQITKAGLGLEVAFAEIGGWDTHVNQGAADGQLAGRLDDFARSIAAFTVDLGDRMDDVVLLTMSEFGRAVNENGNRGTDHGHAGALFVIGGNVKGGKVHGKWPGLEQEQLYEGRDLALTTDFRSVFAEVVSDHMGARALDKIFPGYTATPSAFLGIV
jgi:uncharacterized protein (DUF1501 family)